MATDNINAMPTECTEDQSKEVKMLTLPVEIIKKILSYVEHHSRSNAALVCHTFYELICELERDRNPIDICYSDVKLNFGLTS